MAQKTRAKKQHPRSGKPPALHQRPNSPLSVQQTKIDPTRPLTPTDVLQMQHQIGNRAVTRHILKTSQTLHRKPATGMVNRKEKSSPDFYAYLANLVIGMASPVAIQILITAGIRDVNRLTNLLFWARHPDMVGEKIKPNQKDLVRDWLRIRDQIVKPSLEPATSNKPTSPTPTIPTTSLPVGTDNLNNETLASLVATLNNPDVTAAAQDLATIEQQYRGLAREVTEEFGSGRDKLVADIAALRQKIKAFDSLGLDPATLARLKTCFFRAINNVSPYYSQYRNIDLLEGKAQAKQLGTSTSVSTRTCNITSLSMALESLGKSANDYDSSKRDAVGAAARVFKSEVGSAKLTVGDDGLDWDALVGLRLSDFMELAAIAEELDSGKASNSAVTAAAVTAWGKILSIDFLKKLAERFGTSATVKAFTFDPNKSKKDQRKDTAALHKWGRKYRHDVEKLTDARNAMEAASGKKKERLEKEYNRQLKNLSGAISGADIEKSIPLEAYKQAMLTQVGGEMDMGAAVVVLMSGHYVRLQALHDDHVIVDDPGRQARANRKVTWAEARAMGYFRSRLVITA